jgi:hypothetical protein
MCKAFLNCRIDFTNKVEILTNNKYIFLFKSREILNTVINQYNLNFLSINLFRDVLYWEII